MLNSYSCDRCKNKGSIKCMFCRKRRSKQPTRFELDKSICQAYDSEGNECLLVAEIRHLQDDIREIDEKISALNQLDISAIFKAVELLPLYRIRTIHHYSSKALMHGIAYAMRVVGHKEIVEALNSVYDADVQLFALEKQKEELNDRLNATKRRLGI